MSRPELYDCAVVMSCDRNYFHLALFMVRQIAFHNPHRRFDFVIASRDELALPDWAKPLGVTIHRSGDLPANASHLRSYRGSKAPLYRIMLSRELQSRYRRLLYLDCDMFVEGGDFNRLMEIDLGPHPIGAVLDAPFMYEANFHAQEYARLGWKRAPYANTGLQVIDTKAYVDQGLEERSFEAGIKYPQAIVFTDQSLTNIALHGKFAQLAPCWNWQWNFRLPLVAQRYAPFIRHFIGPRKPDRESSGLMDARFNQAYREFLTQFMPELLSSLSPRCDPMPMSIGQVSRMVFRHFLARPQTEAILKRFADPYRSIY